MINKIIIYMYIGICGMGFVGNAIYKSFKLHNINVIDYDKYNTTYNDDISKLYDTDIIFLCLPTKYNSITKQYDKEALYDVCDKLSDNNYKGIVVIKSTVEPNTTTTLQNKYTNLLLCHNPEFLTAKTAFKDFHTQKHIVLGFTNKFNEENKNTLINFYSSYYKDAEISVCTSVESESMKLFCNNFYAMKIQIFNEFYMLCNKLNCSYDTVKELMLKNGWINPMHTLVPGTDGLLSYGGYCFTKDTNALLEYMKNNNSPHDVLKATINERNEMRGEKTDLNIIK
jgi:UDPglucose 6-dehydrogenase